METASFIEMLVLVLADMLPKNNAVELGWGGGEWLSSVCTKLEPARSKSNKILDVNVLQKFSPHAL